MGTEVKGDVAISGTCHRTDLRSIIRHSITGLRITVTVHLTDLMRLWSAFTRP